MQSNMQVPTILQQITIPPPRTGNIGKGYYGNVLDRTARTWEARACTIKWLAILKILWTLEAGRLQVICSYVFNCFIFILCFLGRFSRPCDSLRLLRQCLWQSQANDQPRPQGVWPAWNNSNTAVYHHTPWASWTVSWYCGSGTIRGFLYCSI